MVMGVQDKALSATQKNAYLFSQTTRAKTKRVQHIEINVAHVRKRKLFQSKN
jgi:hypothetical protein